MGNSDENLSDEEIKNNEEYARGNEAGLEGNFISDAAQTVADTDSLWDKGYEEGERVRHNEPPCFLTTACTRSAGLPDNCFELSVLRAFRDNVLMKNSGGRIAVKEYYNLAPDIVSSVNSSPNSKDVWNDVYSDVVIAANLVRKGSFEDAFRHYKSMVNGLKGKFLS